MNQLNLTWTPPDKAAEYFPPSNGLYEVAAGLRKFGTDFGNGVQDQRVFQLDSDYQHFVNSKIECRNERLSKYYAVHPTASSNTYQVICKFIMQQLVKEYPEQFELNELPQATNNVAYTFLAKPLALNFELSKQLDILNVTGAQPKVPFCDLFDALALCVQDDIAIMEKTPDGGNILTRAHICSAGHWAPEEKIGHDFVFIHKPVPGSEAMNRSSRGLVEGVINKGPYVRFTWSIVTDRRLNHHPDPPPGILQSAWDGRQFNLANPDFHLRVERQTLIGFAEQGAFLFCIRPQYLAGEKIKADSLMRKSLISALESMTPESRVYKGLGSTLKDLVAHLAQQDS
jgi:dimethylamine monooxygenase subunit A